MSTRSLGQCLVCDDRAIGINFAVPTCAACKAFFRRNAVKLGRRDFVCREDGDCPVDFKSRRFCNCCRLAKCFRVGMQKTLIRSEAERQARKQLVEQNRQKRVRYPTVKTSNMMRPANLLLSNSNPFQHMSPIDQTRLTNILSAYERTCIATKMNQSPAFPVCKHSSIHAFLSEYSERQKSLVKYFRLLPEFTQFSINDKIRLIRNNFSMTLSINEAALSTNISQHLIDSVSMLYSASLSAQLIQCIKILHSYIYDRTLLKLLLTIQSFTSGIHRNIYDVETDRVYDDTRTIFVAQNVYVDLLWKYLLTRFPTEIDAVRFYDQIIRDLLFVQRVVFMTDSFVLNHSNEIQLMEPLIKSMWPASDNCNTIT